jgi:hypothetical protein
MAFAGSLLSGYVISNCGLAEIQTYKTGKAPKSSVGGGPRLTAVRCRADPPNMAAPEGIPGRQRLMLSLSRAALVLPLHIPVTYLPPCRLATIAGMPEPVLYSFRKRNYSGTSGSLSLQVVPLVFKSELWIQGRTTDG